MFMRVLNTAPYCYSDKIKRGFDELEQVYFTEGNPPRQRSFPSIPSIQ